MSMSSKSSSASIRIQKLQDDFFRQLPSQIHSIREMLNTLNPLDPSKDVLGDLHRNLHTLKGSSAVFGLKDLSAAANDGEHLVRAAISSSDDAGVLWQAQMEEYLDRMADAVPDIDSIKQCHLLSLDLAAAETIHAGKERKRVYLCDDDPFQLSSLTTHIGCFGFEVLAFTDLSVFLEAVRESAPDVIVMDMIHPDNRIGGAQAIQEIQASGTSRIPVVYISLEDGLESRLAAVRAGCDAYFVKPLNPTSLCATLTSLTTSQAPDPYRILIVEDDPFMSEMYGAILEEAGMEVLSINDPMQALAPLDEFKPDLILMDMHMPGCNGMELAKAIRQIDACISIPIVFLSSETDVDLHYDAKRMGGDEFLVKPIKPEHLVSAVVVRAQRMKLLRSYMIRDSLTGLFNHSTTKEYLELNVDRAQRSGENLCFAMIDLDHFKGINDRYGHPVGDRVLVVLADLLRQRLRKSDVVGRYGGEEFAIILPGCTITEATLLMNQLRQCFETIDFPVDVGTFSATFSCGIASLESHDNSEKLCLAADQALYQAKKEGRNLVVTAGSFLSKVQLMAIKVLLVDEDPSLRLFMSNMLEGVGISHIVEAKNGQEAWHLLKSQDFDLIIGEWHMAGMSGLELLKAVRADTSLEHLPFVMITSERDKKSIREALQAGVSEYILKPVFLDEFSKKIIRALCKRSPIL